MRLIRMIALNGVVLKFVNPAAVLVEVGQTVVFCVESPCGQFRVCKPDLSSWIPECLFSGHWCVCHSGDEAIVKLKQVRVKLGEKYSIMCYENTKAMKPFEKLRALSKPFVPPAKKPRV